MSAETERHYSDRISREQRELMALDGTRVSVDIEGDIATIPVQAKMMFDIRIIGRTFFTLSDPELIELNVYDDLGEEVEMPRREKVAAARQIAKILQDRHMDEIIDQVRENDRPTAGIVIGDHSRKSAALVNGVIDNARDKN